VRQQDADIQAGYGKGCDRGHFSDERHQLMLNPQACMHPFWGFCLESLLIDNDMLGSINRNVRRH